MSFELGLTQNEPNLAPQPPMLGEPNFKIPQRWGLKALRAYKKRGRVRKSYELKINSELMPPNVFLPYTVLGL
jgi:hypothetical protein